MRRSRGGVAGVLLLLTVGCGAGSAARHGAAGSYAQMDSATAACRRNPAYCARGAGAERIVPLTVRAAQVGAAGKAWADLEESKRKGIEHILVECARWADAEVNRQEFGKQRHPTPAECEEQVGGSAENPISRRMALGTAKHSLARQCAEEKLGSAYPGRFSLEQRYRLHPETRRLEQLKHETELEMLRRGGKELVGSVVPDVVIHTGDPLQPQRVYDFKFPCPEDNKSPWRAYPPGNPLRARHQGHAYETVLNAESFRVTPKKVLK